MRQFAFACGYTAASIRERIYAQEADKAGGAMAGILLYTADSDSEGTLGGLVSRGKDLGAHISDALAAMRYCASDPLCAEHTLAGEITLVLSLPHFHGQEEYLSTPWQGYSICPLVRWWVGRWRPRRMRSWSNTRCSAICNAVVPSQDCCIIRIAGASTPAQATSRRELTQQWS